MSDEAAIQQVLNRYTAGCNRQDWDQVMATFLEDGVWDAGGKVHQGRAEMLPSMSGFIALTDYFVQLNSPAVIAVAGDEATARSPIRECGRFKGGAEAMEVLGYYEDRLVRTAAGWQFASRKFHTLGMHRFSLLPDVPVNL